MGCETTDFGTLLKQARDRAGYSQAMLGFKFRPGISRANSQNMICRFETGKQIPTKDECRRLAEILDVPPQMLRIEDCPQERKTWKAKQGGFEPRVCPVCGKEFVPTRNYQINCSSECTKKDWWEGETARRRGTTRGRKCVIKPVARRTAETPITLKHLREMSTEKFGKAIEKLFSDDSKYIRGKR